MVLENVTFGYILINPLLPDVSFESTPGQVVGIFGMTGAGKARCWACFRGSMIPTRPHSRGWHDLRDLDLDAFRRQFGIVYQESFLFSNTVAANIAFGHPHATHGTNRARGPNCLRA